MEELREYESKRAFDKTSEPKPGVRAGEDRLVFVIQKHAARALHYDLRLELDGVLKSWAVPKGPPLEPSSKRLAMMVEDHPLDYKDFEGVIPEGNYGAGGVIIWDRGTYYHPLTPDRKESEELLREGLRRGDVKFVLEGEKLHGEFALVKTGKDGKSWLFLKKKDRSAKAGKILMENRSVVSNRTLEDVAEAGLEKSFRQRKLSQIRVWEALEEDDVKEAPVTPMPHDIRPMLATLIREPFDHKDWVFEVKWDGYRVIAEISDKEVLLYSRKGISLNQKFPPIVHSMGKFEFDAILDGEVVVVDDQGRSDFQMLQNYGKEGKGHLLYYAFDLLYFGDHDLMGLPLLRRKELLKKILPLDPKIRVSDHVWEEGMLFFDVAREKGLEGIMAKHSRSLYQPGKRGRQWLKIKSRLTQEGVIGGFTEPRGGRRYLGALVLGVFEGDELVYIGHTGGGFDEVSLKEIRERLDALIQPGCPFSVKPKTNMPVTWVNPELVCEVAFHEWTSEGLLRQPVFMRLREDKTPREVVRERA